jgi:glycosyltransferase involved in cell wall biosynthesis
MKVLHLTPSYFSPESIMGGGERYALELARAMAEKTETRLVSFGSVRSTEILGKLRQEIYPVTGLGREFLNNPRTLLFWRELLWADVVQTHQVNTWVADAAVLLARLLGKPCFGVDHGGGGARVLNRRLPVFGGYDAVVAQSKFAVQHLPKPLRGRAVIIPGGVNVDFFQRGLPDRTRPGRILFVGRLLPHKGVHHLVEAVRELNDPGVELHVVGSGGSSDYAQKMRAWAAGLKVVWREGVTNEELRREYEEARVTVLVSSYRDYFGDTVSAPEMMGLVLLESQSCGTPVICTDVGGMPEFLQTDRTGWRIPADDVSALSAALRQALSLPEPEREALSRWARAFAETMSWERVADQYLALYQRCFKQWGTG